MKNIIKSLLLCALSALFFSSCQKELTTDLTAVTDITWEATSGGAIITYTAPKNNNLQYIRADYVNDLGNAVFNVCSVYDRKIEVSGLMDETKSYPITLTSIDKNGASSPVATVMVTPSRPYINIVKDNISFSPIMGGLYITWTNPSGATTGGKPVHVTVTYDTPAGPVTRYLSSSQENVEINIRNIDPGDYNFTYTIEDNVGNKAKIDSGFDCTIPEEITIPKYTEDENGYRTYIWELVPELTTVREVWENRNAAIFDGEIDDKGDANDNSYAGTNADQYGDGQLHWDSEDLDIVVDMHQTVQISRVRAWQRAYFYGWDDMRRQWHEDGWSHTESYYQPTNLKSFKLFGSMDKEEWFLIEHCDIATNTTAGPLPDHVFWTDADGWESWGPSEECLQIGREGHLWEFKTLSPKCRYFRIRFTSNWDKSKREVSGLSELTIYGGIVSDGESE